MQLMGFVHQQYLSGVIVTTYSTGYCIFFTWLLNSYMHAPYAALSAAVGEKTGDF
jgi:hypothetical protein